MISGPAIVGCLPHFFQQTTSQLRWW